MREIDGQTPRRLAYCRVCRAPREIAKGARYLNTPELRACYLRAALYGRLIALMKVWPLHLQNFRRDSALICSCGCLKLEDMSGLLKCGDARCTCTVCSKECFNTEAVYIERRKTALEGMPVTVNEFCHFCDIIEVSCNYLVK
jgi:hypothetical protein